MKFFWSVLSHIYTDLHEEGFVSDKPPAFLFNKPKKKLECQYSDVILVDKSFDQEEQKLIIEALKNLEDFCNGLVQIILKFDLDPNDTERISNNSVLIKATPEHPDVYHFDGYNQTQCLGLCTYKKNNTCRLYLVADRLCTATLFRTTAIHELGHFISLGHTEMPSIMHKSNCSVLYPTFKDACEMAHVWSCTPYDFKFFKL